jgi:hypothetical protein
MPLFTEVLSAIDLIKNTYTSNKRLNEKETFFRFLSFPYFFCWETTRTKNTSSRFHYNKRGVVLLRTSER